MKMISASFALHILVFVSTLCSAFTHHHGGNPPSHANTHGDLAKRIDIGGTLHDVIAGARLTFYDVGLGACGQTNLESDFIVALNAMQFGVGYPGPSCFKTITIKCNGKSAHATIMDMCPGCPYGGLDLSRGLFRYFASESEGVIYGDWHYGTDSESPSGNGVHLDSSLTLSSSKPQIPTSTDTRPPESVHPIVKPSSNTPIATRLALPTYWPMPDAIKKAQDAMTTRLPPTSTPFYWQTPLPLDSQSLHTTVLQNDFSGNTTNATVSAVNNTTAITPQPTTNMTTNSTDGSSSKDATSESGIFTEIATIGLIENFVALNNILGKFGLITANGPSK